MIKIKFNKTGTHIHKGKLKIRLDIYSDVYCKTYVQQYIDVFARELTEEEKEDEELQALVPKKKQLNPFLCHFISVDPNITKQELKDYIKDTFDKKTLDKLDDILSANNRQNELIGVLRKKVGGTDPRIELKESDKEKVNQALIDCEVSI